MSVRLPAEWEPQSGLLLTWPHPDTDWRPWLGEVETVFVDITRHVSAYQIVIITCNDAAHRVYVEKLLQHASIPADKYRLYIAPSNDSWARDHGPMTVLQDDKHLLLDFTFNGWGGKYPAKLDNKITSALHSTNAFGQTPLRKINFVLEGGSIETDGQGTLLTTISCLLSSKRNKGLTQAQIEAKLFEYLGVRRIIWFNHGKLLGDDTDGHIDTLIRFINTQAITYVACNNPDNPNYESLSRMADELHLLMQTNGQPYKLIPLPSPIITDDDGGYLPVSYANFLIINDAVLIPLYDTDTDNEALGVFHECFPDRKIIGINCRPLICQYGSLHCVTMQLPRGVIT